MFNKIIYDPIIIPKIESELDLDEIGLITSMINNIEAYYKDAKALSEILGISINEIYTAAKKLAEKGYLIPQNSFTKTLPNHAKYAIITL